MDLGENVRGAGPGPFDRVVAFGEPAQEGIVSRLEDADAGRRIGCREHSIESCSQQLGVFLGSVEAADRDQLVQAVSATRKAMAGEDVAALRAAVDELSALTYNMTEKLYAALGVEEGE